MADTPSTCNTPSTYANAERVMRKSYSVVCVPEDAGKAVDGVTADAAEAGTASDAGGLLSSVSGDSDSGVPDVSGTLPVCAADAASALGCWVCSTGLGGRGGTVGK